jgi:hypothetical protein
MKNQLSTATRCVLRAAAAGVCLIAVALAPAQTSTDRVGPTAMVPVLNEPPARLVVYPASLEALPAGIAVVSYRTENLRPVPVFGAAALTITPRVGHVHVSVDDVPWVWASASGDPVTVAGLAPGPHAIRIQLMNANHQRLDEGSVRFVVPQREPAAPEEGAADEAALKKPPHQQPPAKLIAGAPLPEPLSRGVVFIRYRAENLSILPVFGRAAQAVSPRVGHLRVTVGDARWHWVDASGNPVIIQGLAPGSHQIHLELADAAHEVIARETVTVTVPVVLPPRQARNRSR